MSKEVNAVGFDMKSKHYMLVIQQQYPFDQTCGVHLLMHQRFPTFPFAQRVARGSNAVHVAGGGQCVSA